MSSWFVYILDSEVNGSFYKGYSEDVAVRLDEHNRGKSAYTAPLRPWKLVWYTEKSTKKAAKELEVKLKNITSRKRLVTFMEKYPFDLAKFDSPDADQV
jgi:putative endonuclease